MCTSIPHETAVGHVATLYSWHASKYSLGSRPSGQSRGSVFTTEKAATAFFRSLPPGAAPAALPSAAATSGTPPIR